MKRTLLQHLVGVLVLAGALFAGWYATNLVRDTASPSGEYSACFAEDGGSSQVECLSDRFIDGARLAASNVSADDRSDAINLFVRRQERAAADDPRVAGICHPAMHELGRSEGSRAAARNSAPEFPSASTQLCTAGYVHGLAEGYLVGTPSADVRKVFPELCHDADAREGCAHGVGHALLRARVDDRPLEASAAAVDRCGALPGSFPDNCMNGVFMELAMRTEPVAVDPDDFVETCRRAGGVEEKLSCWSYLGLNLTTNEIELSEVPMWCSKASLPGQFQCIEEYGRDLGVQRVEACGEIDRITLQKRCIDGAVALQVGSGHVEKDAARDSCRSLTSKELVSHCEDAVDRYARGRARVESA